MATLEDTLAEFGATADFWATARQTDTETRAHGANDEAWEEVKSLVMSLPEAEGRTLANRIFDCGNKPLYLLLAEIHSERGDEEAASKAREKAEKARKKAYEAVLNEYPDPQHLSRLGYLLLKGCGAEELPLCEEDFQGTFISFGDSDTLIVPPTFFEPEVREGFNDTETLGLAIRAFGLAWLYYNARYEQEIKKMEAWRQVLALDGLRIAFLEADNLDAVNTVCEHFDIWLEFWEEVFAGHGLVEPFVANFRETGGYLRGRQTEPATARLAPNVGRDLLATQRLLAWQVKELLSEVRDKQLSAEEIDSLSAAVAQKLEKTPSHVVERYEEGLAREFAERWLQLPVEVRHLLSQAECLRSIVHQIADFDWSPVVMQYIRATETLLRKTLGEKLDAQNLRELQKELNKGFPFATARIEIFRNLFQRPQFAQLAPALGISESSHIPQLASELDTIVKSYRSPHFHGPEQAYPLKVKELRNLLLSTEPQGDGLLWKINSLCTSH